MAYTALPDADTDWVRTAEASALSGIPASTLQYWARTGTGPLRCRRLGRKWIWRRADLQSLLDL
ncbi:MAG: helix-turn-helix domain-containing protein [Gordonia amarae]